MTTQLGTVNYVYDDANRLVSVGGVSYTWDNNGNLLSDGTSTYSYDHANRLKSVVQGSNTYTYEYNGLNNRVSQTLNTETPTRYVLDQAAGLVQVLSDGSYTYLYGNDRIAQQSVSETEYFLTDALGSVRQLVDGEGEITLNRSYDPYGNVLASEGNGESAFAFTGEQMDDYSGLLYLRARYYSFYLNQFIQADDILPDPENPSGWNLYSYSNNSPINYFDPTGNEAEKPECTADTTVYRYCQLPNFGNAVIDIQHFYSSQKITVEIVNALNDARGKGTRFFHHIELLKNIFPYSREYKLSIPASIQKGDETFNGIALGIFMNYQYGLETFESITNLISIFIPKVCTGGRCSGFANEDLPSDYLGFVSSAIFHGWSITDVANKFHGGVALKEEDFPGELKGSLNDAWRCSVLGQCGIDNPYNKCWEFKVPDPAEKGKYRYLPWPEEMIVKPISSGKYWKVNNGARHF
jgi:RHS repeat-associated protein